jgi:hypothetical protein
MKKLFLSVVCCLMMSSMQSFAQEEAAANPEMEAWMNYMTPSETHHAIAESVGEWTTKATFWMEPGGEPTVSEGTATAEMILGGRYLQMTNKGNMMGMEYEGLSTVAFDNATHEYINTWIDNMGTGLMICKGKLNEETGKIEMEGTYVDPMTGTEEPFRQTYQIVDNNHHLLEMFTKKDGEEFKSLVVEYTRNSDGM